MLIRLKDTIRAKINLFIKSVRENKLIFILVAVGVAIGVLLALGAVGKASERYSDGNIITKIHDNSYSYLPTIIKTLLFSVLFYLLSIPTVVNRVLFFLNFLFPLIFTRFFMVKAFVSCALDGFSGYILLFAYYLPILCINGLLFTVYLCVLYRNTCAGTNWKYFAPIVCTVKSVFPTVKKFPVLATAINVTYTVLLIVILGLIL